MSDDDEWYESDDTVDKLLGLLDDADKTPVEKLQEQVKEIQVSVKHAYEQLQAANAEFQRQQQLLNSKQKELAAAQQAAAQQAAAAAATPTAPQQTTPQQYIIALRKSRQGKRFKEWLQDASKNKERQRLYKMYTQIIKDKLADPMKMPTFGKYLGEK